MRGRYLLHVSNVTILLYILCSAQAAMCMCTSADCLHGYIVSQVLTFLALCYNDDSNWCVF